MSDVSLFVVSTFAENLEEGGYGTAGLFEGTSLDPADAQNFRRGRCSWDDFATVVENSARILGGLDALEAFGRAMTRKPPGVLAMLAARYGRPHTMYYLGAVWYGPSLFKGVSATVTYLPDGIIQSLTLAPEHRPSEAVYRAFAGILGGAPRLMGWPEAVVDTTWREHEVAFRIRLVPPDASAVDPDDVEQERADADADIAELVALSPPSEVAAEGRSVRDPTSLPLSQRVRWLLETEGGGVDLSARKAARRLGLSERSLARGLSGEGTTYTELRDERRQALAIERLERGERIDDVASALGFSDASSFSRAFRRWTGRSPGSYRAAG